jgi:site-specific DNA recombinase
MYVRNKYGALLKGLVYCKPCARPMMHTYSSKGNRRYRYYMCYTVQKQGWHACPSKSIPAEEIERFVVEQIRAMGNDPGIMALTLEQARAQVLEETTTLEKNCDIAEREIGRIHAEMAKIVVDQRVNANHTPGAVFRDKPITIDFQEQVRSRFSREKQEVGPELPVHDLTWARYGHLGLESLRQGKGLDGESVMAELIAELDALLQQTRASH